MSLPRPIQLITSGQIYSGATPLQGGVQRKLRWVKPVLRNRNRIILTPEEPELEPYPCSRFRFRFL
jgi:hypothetical protein